MSLPVLLLVLAGALLHASWNIIVKSGANKLFETAINALGAGLGAMLILPFIPLPNPACLGLLAASCACHLAYYICMAATYMVADLSLAYTIMRGTAPMLTALVLWFGGVSLPLAGWGGIILLCFGILTLALQQKLSGGESLRGILYALRTSLMIMSYTLADGFGARLSEASISYTCWIFFLNIFPINIWVLARHGNEYIRYLGRRYKTGIPGGLCGLASYGIAIWAMTVAPIALVAALRETSVIFGMILAIMFLGEKFTWLRALAILLVVSGIILTKLG